MKKGGTHVLIGLSDDIGRYVIDKCHWIYLSEANEGDRRLRHIT